MENIIRIISKRMICRCLLILLFSAILTACAEKQPIYEGYHGAVPGESYDAFKDRRDDMGDYDYRKEIPE